MNKYDEFLAQARLEGEEALRELRASLQQQLSKQKRTTIESIESEARISSERTLQRFQAELKRIDEMDGLPENTKEQFREAAKRSFEGNRQFFIEIVARGSKLIESA